MSPYLQLSPSEYLIYSPYLSHLRSASHHHSTHTTHGHIGSAIDPSGEYLFVAAVVRRWLIEELGVDGGLVELTLSRLPSFTSPRIPSGEFLACLRLISHTYAEMNKVTREREREKTRAVASTGPQQGNGDGTTNDSASGTSSISTSTMSGTGPSSGSISTTTSTSFSSSNQDPTSQRIHSKPSSDLTWTSIKIPDECVFVQGEPVIARGWIGSDGTGGGGRSRKNGSGSKEKEKEKDGKGKAKAKEKAKSVEVDDDRVEGLATGTARRKVSTKGKERERDEEEDASTPTQASTPIPAAPNKRSTNPFIPIEQTSTSTSIPTSSTPQPPQPSNVPSSSPIIKSAPSTVSTSGSNSTITRSTETPPAVPSKSSKRQEVPRINAVASSSSSHAMAMPSPTIINDSHRGGSYPFGGEASGSGTTSEQQTQSVERNPFKRRSVAFTDVVVYSATPPASDVADPFSHGKSLLSVDSHLGKGHYKASSPSIPPRSNWNGIQTISELPRGTFVPSPIPKPIPDLPPRRTVSVLPPLPPLPPPSSSFAERPLSTAEKRVIPPAVAPQPSDLMKSALQAAKEAKDVKEARRNEVQLVAIAGVGSRDAPKIAPAGRAGERTIVELSPAEPALGAGKKHAKMHTLPGHGVDEGGPSIVRVSRPRRAVSLLSADTNGGSSQTSGGGHGYRPKPTPEDTLYLAKAPPAPGTGLVTALISSGIYPVPPRRQSGLPNGLAHGRDEPYFDDPSSVTPGTAVARRRSMVSASAPRMAKSPFEDPVSNPSGGSLKRKDSKRRQSLNSVTSGRQSSLGDEVARAAQDVGKELEWLKGGRGGRPIKGALGTNTTGLERQTILENQDERDDALTSADEDDPYKEKRKELESQERQGSELSGGWKQLR